MDLYNASSQTFIQESDEDIPQEMSREEYDQTRKDYEQILEVAEAARRLAENPDFKLVVMERYFESEPRRLAGLMASGRLNEMTFNGVAKELEAIGKFRSFLSFTLEQGRIAENDLAALDEAWNEFLETEGDPASQAEH